MKHSRPIIAALALLLVGAGCAAAPAQRPPTEKQVTKTYTNADADLTFAYPASWGDVRVSRELPNIDTGKRLTLHFTEEDRVSMTAASLDFSEGVGEGTPEYFTLRPGSRDFSSATSASASLAQPFVIVSWERFADGIFRMTHEAARYGGDVRTVSYLFTEWPAPAFATLMINARADSDLLPDVEALISSIR